MRGVRAARAARAALAALAAAMTAAVLLGPGTVSPGTVAGARAADAGLIATASSPTAVPRTHLRPVDGDVVRAADIPEDNWLPGHRGVDLDARPGSPVRASGAGTIRFAGVVAGTPVVSIDHGDALITTYEPVLAGVSQGDSVSRGQVLGRLADAATLPETSRREPGLSWGARLDDNYIDPMTLLGSLRVRLWD